MRETVLKCGVAGMAVAAVALLGGCAKEAPPPPPPPPLPPSVVLVKKAEMSRNFDAVNRHLELGGALYGYMDIDGDADRAAQVAQTALGQFDKAFSFLPKGKKPDLAVVMKQLGIDDVKAVGISSVRETGGEFRNRAFLYTPNGRHGLLLALGGAPAPLAHLRLAPADADVFEDLEYDNASLGSAIKRLIVAFGGQAAEEKMEQQITATGKQANVPFLDMLRKMKGHFVLIGRVDPTKTMTIPGPHPVVLPAFALLVGVDGMGPDLKPLLDSQPMLHHTDENGRRYYTAQLPIMIEGLRPVIVIDGPTLYFGTSEFFTHECLNRAPGTGLETNPDYQRLIAELGPQVNSVAFVTPRVLAAVKKFVDLNPNLPADNRATVKAALEMEPDYKRPFMETLINQPDGILVEARMPRSFKGALLIPMIYNPITIGSLIYAQSQIRSAQAAGHGQASANTPIPRPTPDQRVQSNLRILWVLSNAYYRRTGETQATYDDLVGPGKMIPGIQPIEGEDYHSVQFRQGQPLRITLPDGRTLSYRQPRPRPQP